MNLRVIAEFANKCQTSWQKMSDVVISIWLFLLQRVYFGQSDYNNVLSLLTKTLTWHENYSIMTTEISQIKERNSSNLLFAQPLLKFVSLRALHTGQMHRYKFYLLIILLLFRYQNDRIFNVNGPGYFMIIKDICETRRIS